MNSTEVGVTIFPFLQEKKGYKERDMEGWKLVSSKSQEQVKKVEREYRITEMRSKKECGKWTDWELDELGFHFSKTSHNENLITKTIISQSVKKIVMLLKCSHENVSIHSAKESRKCFQHKGQGSTDIDTQMWQYLNSGKVRSNIL